VSDDWWFSPGLCYDHLKENGNVIGHNTVYEIVKKNKKKKGSQFKKKKKPVSKNCSQLEERTKVDQGEMKFIYSLRERGRERVRLRTQRIRSNEVFNER